MIAVAQNRPKCPVPMERFSMWHFQTDLPTMIFSMMLSYHDARALYSFINRFNWSFMEKHINIKIKKIFAIRKRKINKAKKKRTLMYVCWGFSLFLLFFFKLLEQFDGFEHNIVLRLRHLCPFLFQPLCLHCLHYFTHSYSLPNFLTQEIVFSFLFFRF